MKQWGDAGTYLVMWSCGDPACNCWEPVIETRGPSGDKGFALLGEEQLGGFTSNPTPEDWEKMRAIFEEARRTKHPDFVEDFPWGSEEHLYDECRRLKKKLQTIAKAIHETHCRGNKHDWLCIYARSNK